METDEEDVQEATVALATAGESVADAMKKKIIEGKQLQAKGDIQGAVSCFADAAAQLSQTYGDLDPNCAEAFHLYGTALLEIVKSDTSFMNEESAPKDDEDGEDDEDGDDDDEGAAGPPSSKGAKEEEEDISAGDDEEINDLQLAWEYLEIARIIYEKDPSSVSQLKLAWVHYDLGEFKLETGDFPWAVDEFRKCLAIRERHCPPDDRLLAEVRYSLGCSEQHAKNFQEALREYGAAKLIMQRNIAKLSAEDPKRADLIGIVEDINQKIEDAKDEEKGIPTPGNILGAGVGSASAAPKAGGGGNGVAAAAPASMSGFSAPSMSASAAAPISTLMVRKRPKQEENGADVKKSKTVDA